MAKRHIRSVDPAIVADQIMFNMRKEDRERDRERNEKVEGEFIIITKHQDGSGESKPMVYADACKLIEKWEKSDLSLMGKTGLGKFMPTYTVKKI